MATAPQIENRKHELLTHPETPQLLQTDALGQSRAKWPARLQLLHSSAGALEMITISELVPDLAIKGIG
jgi:hypothetical protein